MTGVNRKQPHLTHLSLVQYQGPSQSFSFDSPHHLPQEHDQRPSGVSRKVETGGIKEDSGTGVDPVPRLKRPGTSSGYETITSTTGYRPHVRGPKSGTERTGEETDSRVYDGSTGLLRLDVSPVLRTLSVRPGLDWFQYVHHLPSPFLHDGPSGMSLFNLSRSRLGGSGSRTPYESRSLGRRPRPCTGIVSGRDDSRSRTFLCFFRTLSSTPGPDVLWSRTK